MPRLSEVRKPLRDLTQQDIERFWTEIHDTAIDQMKHLVTGAPILKYFDATKDTTLQCDASEKGLGALLTQDEHP